MNPALLLASPKVIKPIVYTVIALIIIYIIYSKSSDFKARLESKKVIKAAENEIIENAATFTPSDYKSMADKLFIAMDGIGTDSDAILQTVAGLKTKTDWLKLVEAFGVKESTSWASSFTGNLIEWMTDELGGDERARVNFSLQKFGVTI